MGDKTEISWTDSTWSPVTGCTRVSPGCGGPGDVGGCYAERLAATRMRNHPRYRGVAEMKGGKPRWTGLVRTHPDFLEQPLRWKRPRRIFVCSQSDLFHENVPDDFIAAVFGVMAACPQHTFQVLTKRAERLPEWFRLVNTDDEAWSHCIWEASDAMGRDAGHDPIGAPDLQKPWPLPNVWIGVSAERQQEWDERSQHLFRTPAAVRWVSAEPLLGPIDLQFNEIAIALEQDGFGNAQILGGLDWVVAGGESGPGARPMHPDWVRSLRDQCRAAGVAFHFKQWGESRPPTNVEQYVPPPPHPVVVDPIVENLWLPWFRDRGDPQPMVLVGKKAAGRLLDGVLHDEYPVGG